MEENKNDIDELIKSIDSSFKEMSLKDIVSAHENYLGEDALSFDEDKDKEEHTNPKKAVSDKKEEKPESVEEIKQPKKKKKIKKTDIEKKKAQVNDKDDTKSDKDSLKNEPLEKANESENEIKENEVLKPEIKDMREIKVQKAGHIGSWFQTFCYMRIPVIGFIYVLIMAFSKKTPEYKQEFAKGYLLYKVLVWILAIVLLYCLYKIGLGFVDGMLSFIKA